MVDTIYGGGSRSHLDAAAGDAAVRADPPGVPRLVLRLQARAATSSVLLVLIKVHTNAFQAISCTLRPRKILSLSLGREKCGVEGTVSCQDLVSNRSGSTGL